MQKIIKKTDANITYFTGLLCLSVSEGWRGYFKSWSSGLSTNHSACTLALNCEVYNFGQQKDTSLNITSITETQTLGQNLDISNRTTKSLTTYGTCELQPLLPWKIWPGSTYGAVGNDQNQACFIYPIFTSHWPIRFHSAPFSLLLLDQSSCQWIKHKHWPL